MKSVVVNGNLHWLLCVLLFTSGNALAQDALDGIGGDLGDEDLLFADIPSVFSASKYEQKVTEAPARISIVTADEIQRYGYRTFAELLNSLPGFHTTYDRNYSYAGVRGFSIPSDYNTRILLLVDGHRINENIYDGTIIDWGFNVDLDLIDRVEIVRGPASSLYGSSAYFGVINVITKRGRDFQGTTASLALGSQNTRKGRISYGKRLDNDIELLVSASALNSDGDDHLYYAEFDDPDTNNGYADNSNEATSRNFHMGMSYHDVTFSLHYEDYTRGIPTASYETIFNDPRTLTTEGHAYADLKYQHLMDSGIDITTRIFYDDYWYDGDWAYDYADAGDPPDEVVFQDNAKGNWWGAELLITQQWLDNHRISLGAEYRNSLREKQEEYDIYDVYLDSDTNSHLQALFMQDEYQVSSNLILNLGLRYDDYSTFGGTTNPRLALIWSPQDTSTFKFLYGTAFRAPNAYELYYHDGDVTQKQAQNLQPETIETWEMILEQKIDAQWNMVFSIYRNNIEDLLSLITDPADDLLVIANIGSATSTGAELELRTQWDDGWKSTASWSLQNTRDENDVRLVNSPLNMFKLNVIAPLQQDAFSIGFELQYESARKTLAQDKTENRMLANLTLLSIKWIKDIHLSASVYNVFNKAYSVPGSEEHLQDKIAQDGRTFRVKLDYTF